MIGLLLAPVAAEATTYGPAPDLEALAARSDSAVLGTVRALTPELRGGEVWSVVEVAPATGPSVRVSIPGGCRGQICMTVPGAPRVTVGETVFVFLRDGQPTGFSDGVFHVRGDVGWSDLAAVSVRDAHLPVVQAPLSALLEAAAPLLPPAEAGSRP